MCNRTLKKAIKLNIINKNPLEEIQMPKSIKSTRKIKALTIEEQKEFIKAILSACIILIVYLFLRYAVSLI